MPREQYKPKDKVVMRMTREGAVEENLTEGTSERISKRLEDTQLVKPHEDAAAVNPEEEIRLKQQKPEDLFPEQNPEETPTEQVKSEYKPGELPVHEAASPVPSASDVYRPAQVDVGRVVTDTALSSSMRKTQAVRNVDGEAVMSKAAETAADQPIADDAIPTTKSVWMLPVRSCLQRKFSKKSASLMRKKAKVKLVSTLRMRSRCRRDRANCSLRQKSQSVRLAIRLPPVFTEKSMRLSRTTPQLKRLTGRRS